MEITLKTILGPAYDQAAEQLEAKLQPGDIVEALFAAQIVRAAARLHLTESAVDPQTPDMDRMRQRAELSIRRNLAELRQLQADRKLKLDLNLDLPGVARVKDVLNLKKRTQMANAQPAPDPPPTPNPDTRDVEAKIQALFRQEEKARQAVSSPLQPRNTSRIPAPGRNELCPCGSGQKFKRCHLQLVPSSPPLEPENLRPAA